MNPTKNSIQHYTFLYNKLINREPFAIIRPGDGEFMIMQDRKFITQDYWSFTGGKLTQDLLSIKDLKNNLVNYFIGIPCPDCQGYEMTEKYIKILNISDKQLTYANFYCNKNWHHFTNYLVTSQVPIYYIGPGTSSNSGLNVKNIFNVDPYLVNDWDNQRDIFIKNITDWVDNITKENTFSTFLFSAGPISKYIITILYKNYPNNQFLDVGSALDLFMKGSTNRGYIHSDQSYSNIVCSFKTGHKLITDKDIEIFNGGWSYTPKEMREFFNHIKPKDKYNILEFGAGDSSKILYDIFERYCYELKYDIYENDINYRVLYKNINTILYNINDMENIITPEFLYDIILIDGPTGVNRCKWYSKIRHNVKYDTIILIDDYNHYVEFEQALNYNFTYTILSSSDEPFVPYGEHSWRIITNIIIK